ncbi:glycerophosphodiester phosphodiesterase [Sneathiella marina]|uniref:Glycerophosphodiester phosphodiesterase n=1 Tax=Sneathiella marina TaxID=2950108 RepID=A0ABY4W7F9_9PROT|nr:glycerophosphodiester phosphodiesterase [Sneathiella marina]USG61862.1 glycerophosphodiester phosphodiesterase [Sneathiella marina]
MGLSNSIYLNTSGPIAIAHRGASAEQPENTMAAFEAAVSLGYRYIETDVHLTRDGVLIAFHDDRLDRVTAEKGKVSQLNWSQVKQARVSGCEPIPQLIDILNAWPNLCVNIDPKSDRAVQALAETVKQCKAEDRVCIGSFSGARLNKIRKHFDGAVCTSMGPMEVLKLRLASLTIPGFSGLAKKSPAKCAQIPTHQWNIRLIDKPFIDKAHELGQKVHVWTINDRSEMNRLLDLNVDGIMSDDAALLKSVFEARNLW